MSSKCITCNKQSELMDQNHWSGRIPRVLWRQRVPAVILSCMFKKSTRPSHKNQTCSCFNTSTHEHIFYVQEKHAPHLDADAPKVFMCGHQTHQSPFEMVCSSSAILLLLHKKKLQTVQLFCAAVGYKPCQPLK